jgi:hypothetical protein
LLKVAIGAAPIDSTCCDAQRASLAGRDDSAHRREPTAARFAGLSSEHDPERACLGLDPAGKIILRKDHAQ